VMPVGPKLEAQMAESGARGFGEGAYHPCPPDRGLRERCELPQWTSIFGILGSSGELSCSPVMQNCVCRPAL